MEKSGQIEIRDYTVSENTFSCKTKQTKKNKQKKQPKLYDLAENFYL